MKLALRKLLWAVPSAWLLAVVVLTPVHGATGFMGVLQSPAPVVSPYDERKARPSIALSSQSALLFTYNRKLQPRFERSSYRARSLTFNSVYYRSGIREFKLIPVSVDAPQYLSFRKDKAADEKFAQLTTRSIANPAETGGRGGLGITVNLPKRLNRVFGEGGAGLRVSGNRRIRFSGKSQWTDAAESEVFKQSKFPTLNMEQTYRFDISGTIGSKISVKVSEDSQQDIPLANRLIVRYKGDDDDILKTIEAGNTTLSLPTTRFVGYSQSIRGLFGVKTEAEVGKLRLTAIASQEQGSSESMTISPTGEENADYIRDHLYHERRIFDLGDSTTFQPGDSVTKLFVYEKVERDREPDWQPALLVVDPLQPDSFATERIDFRSSDGVKLLDVSSYSFYSNPGRNQHYIVFSSQRQDRKAIGVQMEVRRKDGSTVAIGHDSPLISGSDTTTLKILKLILHTTPSPQYRTWNLMWRNCYTIPRGVAAADIDIKVFKGSEGKEGSSSAYEYQEFEGKTQRLIEILGLDQYTDATGQKLPDGKVDDRIEIFRSDWGLLIFPHRRPFAAETTYVDANGIPTTRLIPAVNQIYSYSSGGEKTQASQYYIQLVTKARSSVIRLEKANIIEGSERVSVNGRQLQRETDYTINYSIGQITLLSDEATDPNADIDVQFEYAGFMTLQKKTLLGTRAEYAWNKNLQLGGTMLYKSDRAEQRKPRVGQETARSVIYSLDGSWRTQTNVLTTLADALPLVETEAPSNLRIEGEVAQSRPNPNVEGVAFIDDFEAAQEQLSLGLQRTNWKVTTRPVQLGSSLIDDGKILWHTPRDPLDIKEVWDVDPKQGEGTLRTLRLVARPGPDSTRFWAGILRGFNGRIDAQRAQLLELRARVNNGIRGKLHIDIGQISEDVDGDGQANTEDSLQNGVVEEVEDIGLDGLPDALEPGYSPDTLPDPSGDNWFFQGKGKCPLGDCSNLGEGSDVWNKENPIYYEWLNGTEGNRLDPGWLGIPDEEVLNRGLGWRDKDAYFSYVIDFDSVRAVNSDEPSWWRVEGSRFEKINGREWWTYRIPIRDSLALDTLITLPDYTPQWNEVTHIRVWYESDPTQIQTDTIEIAAWYFVQTNWQDSIRYGADPSSPTKFIVASVSEEDKTFDAPPGVEPYHDPNYDVTEAQRGLLMKFENFVPDDTCLAVKTLLSADQYTGYRRLEMYVYGGDIVPAAQDQIMFFFRVGIDSSRFYEQRRRLYPGWDPRNHIDFDFNVATALKDAALRGRAQADLLKIDTTSDDGVYRVRGNPSLNDVRFLAAGIENTSNDTVSGEIWLDELRVTDVRKDVGTAARVSIQGNMADLLSYNFSFESQDAYFRPLSTATRGGGNNNLGNGSTRVSMTYGGSVGLHKFLPPSWGASLSVGVSHSKSTETPLLRSGSDIVLAEEVRRQERSISETNSISVTEKFSRKGNNPLFNILLNRLSTSVSYSRSQRSSVQIPYAFSEGLTARSDFNFGVSKPPTLPIFFWMKPVPVLRKAAGARLGLYPSTWTADGNFSRSLSVTDDVNRNRRSTYKRELTATTKLTYKIFDNLTTTFNISTSRDLSDTSRTNLSLKNLRLGLERRLNQSFSASYDPRLFGFLTTTLSYQSTYSDDYSLSSQSRQSAMKRSWSVGGRLDHMKLFTPKAPSSGGRQPRPQPKAKESTDDAKPQKPKTAKPFYDPALAVLRFVTGWINPVTYSYSEGYDATVPGMLRRPSLKYRFGLEREAGVPTISEGRAPSAGEDQSYQLSSGFTLLGGISTTVSLRQSIARDVVKQGARYKTVSSSWPDLTIRISQFQHFPLIKEVLNKFINVFSPQTGYSRTMRELYDLDGDFLTSRSITVSHNPLLSVNFKVWRSLSLSSSYRLSKDESEKYNPNDGKFQSETRNRQTSWSITSKYSFSAPSGLALPVLGRVRFNSTMNLSADVRRSNGKSETRRAGGGWVTSSDKADFGVGTEISYNFSSQVLGGVRADWRDSLDRSHQRNNHTRQLELWVEIRF
ncbi:MAG TPA: cell surface protein SprA [Candidatus Deferrimicrobium sp.]|nr:cell surface protein SprA [Candidatus Deferrimicrobium sp.]